MSGQAEHLRVAMTGMAALVVAMGVGRFAFTPFLPLMRDDGLVSLGEGGWLASVHFLGYLLGALAAGRLPLAPRPALQASLLVIAVSTFLMGVTESYVLWLVLRWLCGVFSALTLVLVSNHIVAHLMRSGSAMSTGWVFAGVGAGIALVGLGTLALLAGGAGSALSWQVTGGLTIAASLALCLAMGPEVPASAPTGAAAPGRRPRLAWSLIIPYGAAGMGYSIPATFLPAMARDIAPSGLVFAWAWPVFGLAAFGSTLLAAQPRARLSQRAIWLAGQAVMAFGVALPALAGGLAAIVLSGLCVGGTFMVITMAGMRETHRMAPGGDVARHIAAMTAAFAAGQMIGPALGGWVFELTGSLSAALAGTSALLAASASMLVAKGAPGPGRAGGP